MPSSTPKGLLKRIDSYSLVRAIGKYEKNAFIFKKSSKK